MNGKLFQLLYKPLRAFPVISKQGGEHGFVLLHVHVVSEADFRKLAYSLQRFPSCRFDFTKLVYQHAAKRRSRSLRIAGVGFKIVRVKVQL